MRQLDVIQLLTSQRGVEYLKLNFFSSLKRVNRRESITNAKKPAVQFFSPRINLLFGVHKRVNFDKQTKRSNQSIRATERVAVNAKNKIKTSFIEFLR